jgi:hypothetical protein
MPPHDQSSQAPRTWRAGRLRFVAHKDAEFERLHPRGRGGRFARKPWLLHHHDDAGGGAGGGRGRAETMRRRAAADSSTPDAPGPGTQDEAIKQAFDDAKSFIRPHPDVPRAMLLERAAMVQKKQVVESLTRRLAHLSDQDVLGPAAAEALDDVRAGRKVWVRSPVRDRGEAEDADPDGEFLHPFDDFEHQRMTPEEFHARLADGTLPWGAERVESAQQIAEWWRASRVNRLIASWAETSNGTSVTAHALQESARKVFGLGEEHTAGWYEQLPDGFDRDLSNELKWHGPLYEAFLTAMWEQTQEWFAQRGITHLTAYRGMLLPAGPEDPPDLPRAMPMRLRPMSAFTFTEEIAEEFVMDYAFDSLIERRSTYEQVMMRGRVPVERIIGSPLTGFGCLVEDELVVLAGPGDWEVEVVGTTW